MPPKSVLFVCLGNICRSPSAEAVMKKIIKNQSFSIHLDSAGTANYHTGSPPDERAIFVGKSLGYDLTALQARQVNQQDFYEFDVIFAMDENNFKDLQKIKPTDATAQVMMFDKTAIADPIMAMCRILRPCFCILSKQAKIGYKSGVVETIMNEIKNHRILKDHDLSTNNTMAL